MADSVRGRTDGNSIMAPRHCGTENPGGLLHTRFTWGSKAIVEDACRVRLLHTKGRNMTMLICRNSHIEVDAATNSNLFFWHYQNRHIADRQRTVLWLNGGPGCSSLDGAMMEVGPYRVHEGGNLSYNNGSWDEFANLLFVDQPVGTGFSYVNTDSYLTDLDQMADHMLLFLEKWFALFPEYEHDDVSSKV